MLSRNCVNIPEKGPREFKSSPSDWIDHSRTAKQTPCMGSSHKGPATDVIWKPLTSELLKSFRGSVLERISVSDFA